jgi:hypothetical protein
VVPPKAAVVGAAGPEALREVQVDTVPHRARRRVGTVLPRARRRVGTVLPRAHRRVVATASHHPGPTAHRRDTTARCVRRPPTDGVLRRGPVAPAIEGSFGLGYLAGLFGGCIGFILVYLIAKGPATKKGAGWGWLTQVILSVIINVAANA